jgi:uncharacterized protein YbaR (Trm112 family)
LNNDHFSPFLSDRAHVLPFLAMAVNPELLKILVCPLCKAAVEVVHDGKGLKCSQCHRVYPIRDDIPIMLVSEAKVEN